jgi:hypothetical protein
MPFLPLARRSDPRAGDDRRCGRRAALAAALGLALLGASPAAGDTFYVQEGGVDGALACLDPGCSAPTFDLALPAEVFGRIEIDPGPPASIDLDLELWFDPVSLVEQVAGSEDNGVAAIDFEGLTYTATGLPATEVVPGSFAIDFGAAAAIEGAQTQWNDLGFPVNSTPASFADADVLVTGNCLVLSPAASCSLSFGGTGFALAVGDPTPEPRFVRQTLGLVLLPEPDEGLLLAVAVAALPLLGRSRIRG